MINTINICLTIATVVTTIFATIPISGYWDPKHQVQHEINHAGFIMATSCLTILTDILVLAMPFWAFMKTQLPLTTKLGVVMIFMTGGLSVPTFLLSWATTSYSCLLLQGHRLWNREVLCARRAVLRAPADPFHGHMGAELRCVRDQPGHHHRLSTGPAPAVPRMVPKYIWTF